MASEMSSPVAHGWFSSALYRLAHFGRGRPYRGPLPVEFWPEDVRGDDVVPLPPLRPLHQAEDFESARPLRSDESPETELIDPLARTRAALEHARRQMPGMLGAPDTEPASHLPEPATPTPSAGERIAAEWREALASLRTEQARFLVEMREDRTRLLEDLETERRLLGASYAAERQQLLDSLGAERQLLLSDSTSARDTLMERLEEERSRLATEAVEMRGLLGELHAAALGLAGAHRIVTAAAAEAVPDFGLQTDGEPLSTPDEPSNGDPWMDAPNLLYAEVSAIADTAPNHSGSSPDRRQPESLEDSGDEAQANEVLPVGGTEPEPAREATAGIEEVFTGPQQDQLNGLVASLEERIRAVLSRPMPGVSPWDEVTAEPPSESVPVSASLSADVDAVEPAVHGASPESPVRFEEDTSAPPAIESSGVQQPALGAWRDFGWRSRPEALAPTAHDEGLQPEAHSEEDPPDSTVENRSSDGNPETSRSSGEQPLSPSPAADSLVPSVGETTSALPDATDAYRGTTESPVPPTPEPILLTLGPVPGVRWLSALEQRLATAPGVERAALVSYRAGLASFRLTVAESVPIDDILDTISDAAGPVLQHDVRGREIRVWLRTPSAGVQA